MHFTHFCEERWEAAKRIKSCTLPIFLKRGVEAAKRIKSCTLPIFMKRGGKLLKG